MPGGIGEWGGKRGRDEKGKARSAGGGGKKVRCEVLGAMTASGNNDICQGAGRSTGQLARYNQLARPWSVVGIIAQGELSENRSCRELFLLTGSLFHNPLTFEFETRTIMAVA
jgi:hypothetical protein